MIKTVEMQPRSQNFFMLFSIYDAKISDKKAEKEALGSIFIKMVYLLPSSRPLKMFAVNLVSRVFKKNASLNLSWVLFFFSYKVFLQKKKKDLLMQNNLHIFFSRYVRKPRIFLLKIPTKWINDLNKSYSK